MDSRLRGNDGRGPSGRRRADCHSCFRGHDGRGRSGNRRADCHSREGGNPCGLGRTPTRSGGRQRPASARSRIRSGSVQPVSSWISRHRSRIGPKSGPGCIPRATRCRPRTASRGAARSTLWARAAARNAVAGVEAASGGVGGGAPEVVGACDPHQQLDAHAGAFQLARESPVALRGGAVSCEQRWCQVVLDERRDPVDRAHPEPAFARAARGSAPTPPTSCRYDRIRPPIRSVVAGLPRSWQSAPSISARSSSPPPERVPSSGPWRPRRPRHSRRRRANGRHPPPRGLRRLLRVRRRPASRPPGENRSSDRGRGRRDPVAPPRSAAATSRTMRVCTHTSPSGCHSGSCGTPRNASSSGKVPELAGVLQEPEADGGPRRAKQELAELVEHPLPRQLAQDRAPGTAPRAPRPASSPGGPRAGRRAGRAAGLQGSARGRWREARGVPGPGARRAGPALRR